MHRDWVGLGWGWVNQNAWSPTLEAIKDAILFKISFINQITMLKRGWVHQITTMLKSRRHVT